MNSLGDPVLLEEFFDVLGLVLELHAGLMGIVCALELIKCHKLLCFETNVLVTFWASFGDQHFFVPFLDEFVLQDGCALLSNIVEDLIKIIMFNFLVNSSFLHRSGISLDWFWRLEGLSLTGWSLLWEDFVWGGCDCNLLSHLFLILFVRRRIILRNDDFFLKNMALNTWGSDFDGNHNFSFLLHFLFLLFLTVEGELAEGGLNSRWSNLFLYGFWWLDSLFAGEWLVLWLWVQWSWDIAQNFHVEARMIFEFFLIFNCFFGWDELLLRNLIYISLSLSFDWGRFLFILDNF